MTKRGGERSDGLRTRREMEWRTRVLALVALIGLGEGNVKAVKYSSGFYFDNGELAGVKVGLSFAEYIQSILVKDLCSIRDTP